MQPRSGNAFSTGFGEGDIVGYSTGIYNILLAAKKLEKVWNKRL